MSISEKFYAEFSNDESLIPNKTSFDEIVNFLRGMWGREALPQNFFWMSGVTPELALPQNLNNNCCLIVHHSSSAVDEWDEMITVNDYVDLVWPR